MIQRTPLLTAILLSAMLAGCSDGPASGEISDRNFTNTVQGDATVDIVQEENPIHDATPPGVPDDSTPECVPETVPAEQYHCVEPSTSISIHFMEMPEPGAESYQAYLTGTAPAMHLDVITMDGVMGNMNFTDDVDYSLEEAGFDTIEVRYGNFVYATAPFADGEQAFTLAPGLDAVTANGTFRGNLLTVTVAGLPMNGTYTGHLYQLGADGTTPESVEHFPVQNGVVEYEANEDLDEYVEFHIHVADSKIQLFQATIE
jgi:hypothetical protein